MVNLKPTPWNFMYLGAILCALICVVMVYKITTTGDTSDEWIIWAGVIVGFSLFGFGFVYEGRNKESKTEPEPTPRTT
ncbi:TPA: hypothetical protein HA344_07745 [Candidatus Bathyarchaeota archaeon]|nr:hypothetical protein [Candidatus Bathyarchaeota archaeon]